MIKLTSVLAYPLRKFFDGIFFPVFKGSYATYIAKLCKDGSTVLDFGCGDGSVSKMVLDCNPTLKIMGVDIQTNKHCLIPQKVYNGKKLPYPNNSFGIVVAADVLHHSKDIVSLLNEMRRVTKKYIIIKDHMVYSRLSYYLICLTDFLSNFPYGIKCAFNYPTYEVWKDYFESSGLRLLRKLNKLDYGFFIGERYNPIFVLKKKGSIT